MLPDKYSQVHSDPRLSERITKLTWTTAIPALSRSSRGEPPQPVDYIYIVTNGADSWVANLRDPALFDSDLGVGTYRKQ